MPPRTSGSARRRRSVHSREEIVGAVVYLASPASKFATGSVLVVDGGYTAR